MENMIKLNNQKVGIGLLCDTDPENTTTIMNLLSNGDLGNIYKELIQIMENWPQGTEASFFESCDGKMFIQIGFHSDTDSSINNIRIREFINQLKVIDVYASFVSQEDYYEIEKGFDSLKAIE